VVRPRVKIDGKHFRRLIEDMGITTQELASKINLSRNTLNAKILGKLRFTLEDIIALLDALNIKFEALFPRGKIQYDEKDIKR
jgi:transcriptional regulator with XRE-family HTH domain